MTWQHYARLIQAKSTSTQAWGNANESGFGDNLDMLALAIHESKAHDVAALILHLMGEVNDLRHDIHRCDFCGGVMEHFTEKQFEGYLCPKCDADKIADLQKQTEQRWMFEKTIARHNRAMTEK
jgi:hypothetical protein